MKVFCASLVHESNGFSPIPTNLESYQSEFLFYPKNFEQGAAVEFSPDDSLRKVCVEKGYDIIDGIYASACPSAPTRRDVYEGLRDELLEALVKAPPVDMVLLFLHGAQMAEDYEDCEGDLLQKLRKVVGDKLPVGVLMDLHCNVSQVMIDSATILVSCKEYPHTDFMEMAEQLVGLMEQVVMGRIKPSMNLTKVPMLGFFHTTREPMKSLMKDVKRLESKPDVLSISINHGFPYADNTISCFSVVVITNDKPELAAKFGTELAKQFFAVREQIDAPLIDIEQALDQIQKSGIYPVVVADTADNPGGGASGDSTFILKALLRRDIGNSVLGIFWDPAAVYIAKRAGRGATLKIRLGGKCGPGSGEPLDLMATVLGVRNDIRQDKFGYPCPLGEAVALKVQDIVVIVSCNREQVHDRSCFEGFDINLEQMNIIVVKSAQHFYTAYSALAKSILYVDSPGTTSCQFSKLPYRNLNRPVWPLDEPPFQCYGVEWH